MQAAINAARVDLPTDLRSNPTYRKVNPADAPVMILALTSRHARPGQIYDAVSNIAAAEAGAGDGVGEVEIGGGSLPAVRVELNPIALNKYGDRPRGRARGARSRQRQPAQGRDRGRRPALADLHQRPGAHGGRVPRR